MRKRLFWTNIPVVGLPADRNLTLKDVLQPAASVSDKYETSMRTARVFKALKGPDDKARCLTATCYKGSNANGMTNIRLGADGVRRLTPIECERLQGLPDGYTASISDKARYRALGNGFNIDVIKFIIGFIPS
jgi:site-specific DNA-cytosine methylase